LAQKSYFFSVLIQETKNYARPVKAKDTGFESQRGPKFKSGECKWRSLLQEVYLLPFVTE
jgi:hypothetical protein